MARRRRRRRRRRRSGWLSRLLLLAGAGFMLWLFQRADLRVAGTGGIQTEGRSNTAASVAYHREDWPHWSDADGDCQDTRQEVLIAESKVPVTFRSSRRCTVKRGRWRCPYTGKVVTDPRKLDVDHLIPLAEAHRSGGEDWDRARRERYANALDDPSHLIAVLAGANRSKGDKGPGAWMPAVAAYRCEYLADWQRIKKAWGLRMDPRERAYVRQAQNACNRGQAPSRPSSRPSRAR